MKTYKGLIYTLEPNQVFVFGSNTEGRHGAGSAWFAYHNFGAEYGQAEGLMGQSYGLITTDLRELKRPSVPMRTVVENIEKLYTFALDNPDLEFMIAYDTKGPFLSGFTLDDLLAMFALAADEDLGIPQNIVFEEEFSKLLQEYL